MYEEESSSFEELPIEQRKENFNQISKWFQSQKMAITNTELLTTQVFDLLQNYCQMQELEGTVEFEETKQLMNTFFTKAQRINMKIKRKMEPKLKIKEKQFRYFKQNEDEEVEKNREILVEVKKKLFCMIRNNIPLSLLINYIRYRKDSEGHSKLTLMVDESLLDQINWYLMNLDITEEQWNQDLPQESKLKEILSLLLEIILKQKVTVQNELNEIFTKIQKQFLMKQLEKLNNIRQNEIDKYSRRSCLILIELNQHCKTLEQITTKLPLNRSIGTYNLTKLLLSQCWLKTICLPDILLYTKITGTLIKLKEDKEHSNVIRLRQKITFLKQIYQIPLIQKWCKTHKIMPFEMSAIVPQYLQEKYHKIMSEKRLELFPNKEDYFIESQLKLLIINYSNYRSQLKRVFRDLRFQYNKKEIFDLYSEQVNQYNGDLEGIKRFQSVRQSKDMQIACMIRHLEMVINSDKVTKQVEQIIKFNYVQPCNKHFQFQLSAYDKQHAFYARANYIKLLLVDLIAIEQPFPYLFQYIDYEDGKFQQTILNSELYGSFFYCPQIRAHFLQKYHSNIQLQENDDTVIFTFIPLMHIDQSKPITTIDWEDIVHEHLRLINCNKRYLVEEITFLAENSRFQSIKQRILEDKKYCKEHILLIQELEQFQSSRKNKKALQQA